MRRRPRPYLLIRKATPLVGRRLRLTLTDGSVVERDLTVLIRGGGILEPIRRNAALFRRVRVAYGTVVWQGDLGHRPDVVIWGGAPPDDPRARPAPFLKVDPWWLPRPARPRPPRRAARGKGVRSR